MPVCVAASISATPCSPAAAIAFHVALEQRTRRAPSSSIPDAAARAPSPGRTRRTNWKYIGCSAQSVPSLSKTAMRSGGGTKVAEPSLLTFSTKLRIVFFGAVSFQDASGSCAKSCDESVKILNRAKERGRFTGDLVLVILPPRCLAASTSCRRAVPAGRRSGRSGTSLCRARS